MKGLIKAFGLISALLFSNVQASIYDTASFQSPDSNSIYKCNVAVGLSSQYYSVLVANGSLCETEIENRIQKLGTSPNFNRNADCVSSPHPSIQGTMRVYCTFEYYVSGPPAAWYKQSSSYYGSYFPDSNIISCPPKLYPNYIYPLDSNNDGKPEKCFDPMELDTLSKCSNLANTGSLLPLGGNTANLVCATFADGARCAFSKVDQGNTPHYQPNLEQNCFGDKDIPDYDETPLDPPPQPEQCVPYAGGFACAADPSQYCSADGVCVDGCGYVNDQFVCFRDEQCTGASCSPAPVDCTTNPDAPVCKDQANTPEPSFCEKNPTVMACIDGSDFCKKFPTAASCQVSSGGGSGGAGSKFVLDYDRLINGMKSAVSTLIDTSEAPVFKEFQDDITDKTAKVDKEIDDFMNGSHFESINDQVTTNIFAGQFQLPSGGGCTVFELGGHPIDLCDVARRISSILYFVFAFLTLLYLKNLFFSTVTPRKE